MARIFMILASIAALSGLGVLSYVGYSMYQEHQFTNPNAEPFFFELDPIAIPIMRDGRTHEVMTFVFTIETREGIPRLRALESRPRLRDMLITYLHSLAARTGRENINNTAYVGQQLTLAASEKFGPNIFKSVLVKSIAVRPN